MKKFIVICALLFAFVAGYAQSTPKKLVFNYYASETLDALNLSKEQRDNILAIKKSTDDQIRAVKKDNQLADAEKSSKYKEIYAEASKAYNAITTAEQKEKIRSLITQTEQINLKNGYWPKIDSNYRNAHYDKRMELFKSENLTSGGIVFLGNSITERGKWNTLFSPYQIVNRGIGGDNTFGVSARIGDIIALKPQKLFLMIGVNDLASRGWPVDLVYLNYIKIVSEILKNSPNTKLYLLSVLPINENKVTIERFKGKSKNIATFNQRVKEFANKNSLTYVDLYNEFVNADSFMKEELTNDGIHLSDLGYQLWADHYKKNKLLEK